MPSFPEHSSKTKLLDAAVNVIRSKGYAASTVDDICQAAGVTKGSFFHHFKGKDDLAMAAALHWDRNSSRLFASADFAQVPDPLDRILGYVDFRADLLQGGLPDFTCYVGTMVQEVYGTHPEIRVACQQALKHHLDVLEGDIAAAKELYAPGATWTPRSVADFIQSVLQGAFILAKAEQSSDTILTSLGHLRRYLKMLFNQSAEGK
jgi:TetR/AcrR family transcriptional regulator, transcriptional repressor for nem operon